MQCLCELSCAIIPVPKLQAATSLRARLLSRFALISRYYYQHDLYVYY